MATVETNTHKRMVTGNVFLDTLPEQSAAALLPLLTAIDMPGSMEIARPAEVIERVSFPASAVISAVTRMHDGSEIEVYVIGREGFHGLQCILGDGSSMTAAMVQLPGNGYTMSCEHFVASVKADAVLSARVLRYAQTSLETIGQFAGCNRVHEMEARCARWLLMVHDRIQTDDLPLTHEFLATMLGVGRPTVTITIGILSRAGLIENKRGSIHLNDRAALEIVACECYEQVGVVLERLMGYRLKI